MRYELLDRPIAFHRIFVDWTGTIPAALMLSQLVYWTNRTNNEKGWVYKTAKQWEEETGMSVKEQRNARTRLRECGLVEEALHGVPATLHFRLTPQFRQKVQTSFAQRDKLDLPKGRNCICPKGESITETTQRLQQDGGPNGHAAVCLPTKATKTFVEKACNKLEDFLRSTRKINTTKRIRKTRWNQDMRLLLQDLDGDKFRLKRVLKAYISQDHTQYTPRVFSPRDLRTKFLKVESWVDRMEPPKPRETIKVCLTDEEFYEGPQEGWNESATVDEIPE